MPGPGVRVAVQPVALQEFGHRHAALRGALPHSCRPPRSSKGVFLCFTLQPTPARRHSTAPVPALPATLADHQTPSIVAAGSSALHMSYTVRAAAVTAVNASHLDARRRLGARGGARRTP